MFQSLRRRLPRIGRTPRLCAAAACLVIAFLSALGAQPADPAPDRSTPVVVAARDLPAGHRLTRADLRVAGWPPTLRPAGARATPTPLIGRRLAGPMAAREVVTPARLLGSGLTAGLRAGEVATTVPLDDSRATELVQAGDHVDLLATPRPADLGTDPTPRTSTVATVASNVLVLAVLPAAADADPEVVLAVDRATAVAIARDRAAQVFAVVADPP